MSLVAGDVVVVVALEAQVVVVGRAAPHWVADIHDDLHAPLVAMEAVALGAPGPAQQLVGTELDRSGRA